MGYTSKRDWSNLKEDYTRLGSLRAVAKEYGTHRDTVRYMMIKLGIERTFDLTKTGGQSAVGRKAELFILSLFPEAEDRGKHAQAPYDLLYGNERWNVKASTVQGSKERPQWSFRTSERSKKLCGYFICVLYKEGQPYKVLKVPSEEAPSTGITIPYSENSKYMLHQIWGIPN